jgi:hypothetical protein
LINHFERYVWIAGEGKNCRIDSCFYVAKGSKIQQIDKHSNNKNKEHIHTPKDFCFVLLKGIETGDA